MATKHDLKVAEWHAYFARCLSEDIDKARFDGETTRLSSKAPLAGVGILEAWAKVHDGGFTIRPRLIKCLRYLYDLSRVTAADGLMYVHTTLESTVVSQDDYQMQHGHTKGEWRQCIEAILLQQLALHAGRSLNTESTSNDRLRTMRTYKPLLGLITLYNSIASGISLLDGPVLAIGNALGKYVLVYINALHSTGYLESDNGSAPAGIYQLKL
jgi:hypothetical protein